jgi:hypothetical protein
MTSDPHDTAPGADALEPIHEPRTWRDNGWTAQVIKNDDDDGWAVSMTPHGQAEPALIGPWTMGRDKKNPKPLDTGAFNTLVKTASEVIRRHEQQLQAQLHRHIAVSTPAGRIDVRLDIVPDEDEPHAFLSATDADGNELARHKVAANHRFTTTTAEAWVAAEFAKPR